MATPQQIETKLMAPRCLNNIPFSARAQCPGTGTKSGRGLTVVETKQSGLGKLVLEIMKNCRSLSNCGINKTVCQ